MSDTPTIINPFTKHSDRMKRNSQNTRWISDSENVTRQPRKQTSSRNKAQHMSEPCPRRASPTKTATRGDLGGIFPPVETGQQQSGHEERVSFPTPWYRAAKAIYDSGPEGEGQEMWKVWKMYQRARKEQRNSDKVSEKRGSVRRNVVLEDEKAPPRTPHMRPLVPRHPPPPPPPPPQVDTVQGPLDGTEKRSMYRPRDDSCISPSSIEIPVTIDDCIQRTIDTNKPLPAVPCPEPPPETHETVRPMAPASPPLTVKLHDNTKSPAKKLRSEVKLDYSRWRKHQSPKAQAKLKAKISHPIPLAASYEGSVTNVAAECGGIGGPAAAGPLPIARPGAALPQHQSRNTASTTNTEQREMRRLPPLSFHVPSLSHNRTKSAPDVEDKDKAVVRDDMQPTHWSDTLVGPAYEAGKSIKQSAKEKLDGVHVVRRRKSSDASFVCQGVVDKRLDRYQVSEAGEPSPSSGEDETSLVPERLFSGTRWGRNTQFYQPYVDVLDEY
ncbi:hypothetical protein yc1106_07022 [Curvularia clavata]|uniref:Uncharacterized protein n=1 Tax=Curvularia clavata TaxID=95742 RepID=A0A9Q9DTE3_CURCL|nr:hypothetical protein yc1106_07022 [Curvularia clavata]